MNQVSFTHYGGFQSYGILPISTGKPGIDKNYYVKDAYKDISNYNKRKVEYFDDKSRWNSVYNNDILKVIKESNYAKNSIKDKNMNNTILCQEENLNRIVTDCYNKNGETEKNNDIKSNPDRRKMFSHWKTNYQMDNEKVHENKTKYKYEKAQIPEWFTNKYHNYNKAIYSTEMSKNMGVCGDNPLDKYDPEFNKQTQAQGKLHSDNFDIGLGTSKASTFIPGYSGHIPVNSFKSKDTIINDPYLSINKSNHLLNYKVKLPGYKGHVPKNQNNIKGSLRPYCLSTENEIFS